MPRRRNNWRELIQQGLDNPHSRWKVRDGVAWFNDILAARSDGTLTEAGRIYEELAGIRVHDTFQPGIREVGYNRYAETLAGQRVLVSTRARATDEPTVTKEGRRYFAKYPEENLYNIPARHWYYDNGRLRGVPTPPSR